MTAPPPAPALPPRGQASPPGGDTAAALRPVVVLLLANLALSVALTVATLLARRSIVDYQLDHRHITDPTLRQALRHSSLYGVIGRAVGNVAVSVVYAYLIRALHRGRRWAYRRLMWISGAGILALLSLQATPYPPWVRLEQLAQAGILAALLYCSRRPQVQAHFTSGLPGRDLPRFRSSPPARRPGP